MRGDVVEAAPVEGRAASALVLSADADRKGYIAQDLTLEQLQRRNLAQNIELRRRFASYLLSIHSLVNAAVLVLVFLIALNKATLSERVVITLIASTVAELAGLVLAVATYLFPAPKDPRAGGVKVTGANADALRRRI